MDTKSCTSATATGAPLVKPVDVAPPADEAAELRRELATLRKTLRLQAAALTRQQRRAAELELRLSSRDTAAKTAREEARDREATALLRALLALEASLLREKALITQRLRAKDLRIQQQRDHIEKLQVECTSKNYCRSCQQLMGFTSEQTNIETDPEFHSLESADSHNRKIFERSMSYHEKQAQQPFQKNSRLSKSFQFPKTNNDHANTSSSEEVFEGSEIVKDKLTYVKNKPAFVRKDVTRRSRKFSGRKHTSAYLDAVQKRHTRSQGSSSSAEDGPQSEKDSKFHPDDAGDDCDIGEEISKDIQRASNRIDELLNGTVSSSDNLNKRLRAKSLRDSTLSVKIESLHGIRKPTFNDRLSLPYDSGSRSFNGEPENPWYTNSSDPEPDMDCQYGVTNERLNHRSMSADNILAATSSGKSNSNHQDTSSVCDPGKNKSRSTAMLSNERGYNNQETMISHSIIKRSGDSGSDKSSKYGTCSVKFDAEPNENWYASASDPDDDPSCEIYKNNPVLECVNQILLQNSLDENSGDGSRTYEAVSPKASTKRVQFSTLNSISFDESVGKNGQDRSNSLPREMQRLPDRRSLNKIVKFSLETASEHSYEVPITSEGFNYEVQSIYSNDYEPIITKDNEAKAQASKVTPVPLPRMLSNINPSEEGSPKKMSIVKNMALNLESKINNNHYVDMEAKFSNRPGVVNKRKVPRIPPALPPKPKNLVSKFKLNTAGSNGGSLASIKPMNSDPVASNQRSTDVPKLKHVHGSSKCGASEPDYCSISEINVPVVSCGKRSLILSQATVEIHEEKFSPNIAERRAAVVPKIATISKLTPNKITDKDIPMLPQVTEIIIPDEEEIKDKQPSGKDGFVTSPTQQASPLTNGNKMDLRNSIQMGHSVSTILSDIKNRNCSIDDVNKSILSPDHIRKYPSVHKPNLITPVRNDIKIADKTRLDLAIFEAAESDCEKFDLSQNFEEFKIDDCEFTNEAAEEYQLSSGTSDGGSTDSATDETSVLSKTAKLTESLQSRNPAEGPYRIEFTAEDDLNAKNLAIRTSAETNNEGSSKSLNIYSKMSNKPDLLSNIDSIETDSVRYSDLESSNSSSSNCGSYNTVKCEPAMFVNDASPQPKVEAKGAARFEYFLEASGLSSKSILTPSRPPSVNHKSVLKPKDIKSRSKSANGIGRSLYDKCGNTAIKYFEPYL